MRPTLYKQYFQVTDFHIKGFFEDYRFLSNFHESPVWFEGVLYSSSEGAYQAAKTLDPEVRRFQFAKCSPKTAKTNGRLLLMRPDWEAIKYSVMARIVMEKFASNLELTQLLLATENKQLEETNHWQDNTWGVDYRSANGANWLGKILMEVRRILRNAD